MFLQSITWVFLALDRYKEKKENFMILKIFPEEILKDLVSTGIYLLNLLLI